VAPGKLTREKVVSQGRPHGIFREWLVRSA
jgi:hypothetical protein